MENCVFCKIVKGEIPANFIYQDDDIAVFPSIDPKAKVHLLLIPRKHTSDFMEITDELLVKIKNKIIDLVKERKMENIGYRISINGGSAKAVPHLHFHLLGEVSVERGV